MGNTIIFDNSKYFTGFGEVLLRLSPPYTQQLLYTNVLYSYFGGAEANCAVFLSQLGLKTKIITMLPDSDVGKAALRYFRSFGVSVDSVLLVPDSRLGLYFYEKGAGVRPSRLIYDRAYSAFALLQKGDINWEKVLKDCGWFHTTGITLSLSDIIVEETLKACDIVKSNHGIVSFDINYRQTLWKDIELAKRIIGEFVKKVDVLIGNEEHIKKLLLPEQIVQYSDIAEYLFSEYPNIKTLLITHRYGHDTSEVEIGALAGTRHSLTQLTTRNIHNVVDRIGSGDALAAGFMYSYIKGNPLDKCVDFALAAGGLAHMIDGDNFILHEHDIVTLLENASGRLIR